MMPTMPPQDWSERKITLYGSAGMAAAGLYPTSKSTVAPTRILPKKLQAIVVGGTRFQTFFSEIDDINFTSIDESEFSTRISKEKPNLVILASEVTDLQTLALETIRAGAHLYMDVSIERLDLAGARELLALASERSLKVGLTTPLACAANIKRLQIDSPIGEIVEVRAFGKMDDSGGEEDQIFDLIRFFVSDCTSVTARVRGNHLRAYFETAEGIDVTYIDQPGGATIHGPWGIELIGTSGKARIFNDSEPFILLTLHPR